MENIAPQKFRVYLQNELERRKQTNSAYSLRAFAQQLDIHSSCLSAIIRGKRPLTTNLIKRFSDKLLLGPNELELLKASSTDKAEYINLTIDTFEILSKWYHYAILELVRLEDFKPDVEWIAKNLGITSKETKDAIERLKRCELLDTTDNKWIIQETQMYADSFTSAALKRLQQSILKMSIEAVEDVAIESRYHGSMMMAINSNDMEEAKKDLREFREDFCKKYQTQKQFNKVYQLHLGFFPLSKEKQ